jgi:hypothetical protein
MQTKDVDHRRKIAAMSEQIKILEIDQKNLTQAKEMQVNAREVLQADQERLMKIVEHAEIQKLTRKYKLTAIIDRVSVLSYKNEHHSFSADYNSRAKRRHRTCTYYRSTDNNQRGGLPKCVHFQVTNNSYRF